MNNLINCILLQSVELVNKILNALNEGEVVTGVFLDLAKAFDTVDHAILIRKLEVAGIRGCALDLFRSYLNNRTQTVFLNGSYSKFKGIRCGVPQGSVLGPLLFLIYVNDIGALNLKCLPNLFADDTAMFYYNSDVLVNINDAQRDLDKLKEYFRLNKLTLNVSKTKFMNILPKNKILPLYLPLKYDESALEEVSEYKYLGIIIDKHLTWSKNINKICGTISCRVGILRKLSYFLPRNVLLLLYYSMIHCHFEYLCLIWGSASNCFLKPLQVLQNRALKFIYKLNYQHPSVELYRLCQILPIKGIYCQQVCSFVKSVISDAEYHTVAFDSPDHDYDTRNADRLYCSAISNNFGKSRISYVGPCLFNALPGDLRGKQANIFASELKKFLLLPTQLSKLTKFDLF